MNILYLDCPMGISGDMFLAALIDMGVDFKKILKELKKLGVGPIDVRIKKEVRHSITGTTFRVRTKDEKHHRTFKDIKKIIEKSGLEKGVKDLSVKIFSIIAEAKGKIHGIGAGDVHFHEVGAMDSIIDIVGASIAIKSLKLDKVISSPIALGSGWTDTMHGRLPIPAPATLEILKGIPVSSSGVPFELTTPTGAAIVKALATGFGPMPSMTIEKTGYGAGKKDFREAANVLRAIKGAIEKTGDKEAEALLMLEANIDDMSPQTAGYLMERLFEEGALDVYFTPVVMKKSRPGILLSALGPFDRRDALLSTIFAESTTIGVRLYPIERVCLERKIIKVKTRYGLVRVKVSMRDNKAVNIQPEYEDLRAAARRHNQPLKKVMDEARSRASAVKPISD